MDNASEEERVRKLDETLRELYRMQKDLEDQYEVEIDRWWDSLTQDERLRAMYSVIKRLYVGEIQERKTYKQLIHETFGVSDRDASLGIKSGLFGIHSIIQSGIEREAFDAINRFEVIDQNGRSYVKYLTEDEGIRYVLQDYDQTLKVFVENNKELHKKY